MIGWIIVAAGAAGTLWAFAAAIYWLIWPGETDPNHPKRMVLRSDR